MATRSRAGAGRAAPLPLRLLPLLPLLLLLPAAPAARSPLLLLRSPHPPAASPPEPPRGRRAAPRPPEPIQVYGQVSLNDSHNQMVVHWAGEKSNVIVALARDSLSLLGPKNSDVYVSYDYGKSFKKISERFSFEGGNSSEVAIAQFYHSPADNKRYIFVDAFAPYLWITTDFCNTVQGFSIPFRAADLLLHSRNPNLLLGFDRSHPKKQLWKSDDFGQTWIMIQEHVKSFSWGVEPYDKPSTVYIERHEPSGASTVIRSTDFFQSRENKEIILEDVEDFQLRDKYMFATKSVHLLGSSEPPSVQLWVSFNRKPMRVAQFVTKHPIKEYYVADASEDQVFVCVSHDNNRTNLYISEAEGLKFSLSLENVLYYSPGGAGSDTLVRYFANEPFADFHRVEGVRGVYIATLLNGSFSEENMRSVITFDKGGTWELLQPPAQTHYGEHIDCQLSQGCSLHLAQRLSQLLNFQLRRMPILSKESAPGLIIATGSIGKNMARKTNVYVSSSAGARWREALSGPHYYTWGDHGGILVAIAQGTETDQLKYSTNEGETWKVFTFSEKPVFVYGLLTEPGEKSTIFTIFGSYKENGHSWLILQINTTDVLGVPCTENDYKLWSPSDERGNECLLGHKTVFKRRTPHATCFNGEDFDRPVMVSNCSCTREDFECDFGFKLSDDLSLEVCVPDPEFAGKPYDPPVPCPVGSTYRKTRGYRKISGDTCAGGDIESRLEGELVPCPLAEENEFILYATRYSIYRYDLASGIIEELPLAGLRGAVALDFDYDHNCLYWADVTLDIIQRLCLNGSSGQEIIISTGLETVEALAFEPLSRLLYWVNAGIPKIEVANPDGDLRLTVLNSSILERPRALALVPRDGLMFWTDWGDSRAGIYRSDMDGSLAGCIVSEGVRWPNGISVDDHWIYWTEAYMDRIERVDFNGMQRSVILDSLPHPYAIAVFKNEIYWNDWSQLSIFRASKTSGSRMEILVGRLNGIMDMKIFYRGKTTGENGCISKPCSLLCLPKSNHGRSCKCPEGVSSTVLPTGEVRCDCPRGYVMKNNTCLKEENTCLPNQYRCSNGNCINSIWQCDNDNDCGDMSDERNCPTQSTLSCPNGYKCEDGEACIMLTERCDGYLDCSDSSDERNCTDDTIVYKVQNLQWTADFSGDVTLTWARPKRMSSTSCVYNIYYRTVGESVWKILETHSNKTNSVLKVLKPDCTYQVKVQVQCLSRVYNTNDFITLRAPEGLPDAPFNLQLSLKKEAEGVVVGCWSPPVNAHGLIREFIVEYSSSGSKEWSSLRTTTNYTEIKNLEVNTLYTVRVAAVTSRGVGNWSDSKSITTIKGKVIPPPVIHIESYSEDSISFSLKMTTNIKVSGYVVNIYWTFDTHRQEKRTLVIEGEKSIQKVANLTAHTPYELSAWAKTELGDSPLSFVHVVTSGTRPASPSLKAKAINQTAVECSWTGPRNVVYGIFYATSFLELYRSPHNTTTTSHNVTVLVQRDEQYLFLVRVMSPYQGPPSDYVVVKMIPDNRLPPRHLHSVHTGKTFAVIKWESPYDSPDQDMLYAVAVKDLVRKTDKIYKVKTRNSTVEYTIKKLEPGGKYHVIVQLGNMSKESSMKINTVPLSAPDALKIITENDHILLFWKSLALKESNFNESRGYEIHMFDSLMNITAYLGNTTENFFKVSNLKIGHNYSFSVQARCLYSGQMCGEPATLLYDELGTGEDSSAAKSGGSTDVAAIVVPVLFLLLVTLGIGFVVLYMRHRRLQNSFTAFANSHYSSRLGSAIFSSGDDLGDEDDEAPMITGFSDDVPMVIA
ncbi:sortilin-related receptor isoform X3 [Manacus candei]|uniref:sortilin-related receptor isoform X3 n=1 Tax=Manacus candei TaxID=415023 RepID=UPI0022272764|nr:sortilin-related receptor isoform X3 [Manacus candei]